LLQRQRVPDRLLRSDRPVHMHLSLWA
jgi:hypothetical protein